ncbi:MAG: hypothetical protein KUG72_05830 [Pseudomonadales bacterium]|nr:hypothetical protein [Pseudomonadales bacterium]
MRISSNPLPIRNTLVSPEHQGNRARAEQQEASAANTANEKLRFHSKTEPAVKSEYVSRSRSYSDHINDLPRRSQDAIRAYENNTATNRSSHDSAELAGIDLYV